MLSNCNVLYICFSNCHNGKFSLIQFDKTIFSVFLAADLLLLGYVKKIRNNKTQGQEAFSGDQIFDHEVKIVVVHEVELVQ
jgi:hypothetical protein